MAFAARLEFFVSVFRMVFDERRAKDIALATLDHEYEFAALAGPMLNLT